MAHDTLTTKHTINHHTLSQQHSPLASSSSSSSSSTHSNSFTRRLTVALSKVKRAVKTPRASSSSSSSLSTETSTTTTTASVNNSSNELYYTESSNLPTSQRKKKISSSSHLRHHKITTSSSNNVSSSLDTISNTNTNNTTGTGSVIEDDLSSSSSSILSLSSPSKKNKKQKKSSKVEKKQKNRRSISMYGMSPNSNNKSENGKSNNNNSSKASRLINALTPRKMSLLSPRFQSARNLQDHKQQRQPFHNHNNNQQQQQQQQQQTQQTHQHLNSAQSMPFLTARRKSDLTAHTESLGLEDIMPSSVAHLKQMKDEERRRSGDLTLEKGKSIAKLLSAIQKKENGSGNNKNSRHSNDLGTDLQLEDQHTNVITERDATSQMATEQDDDSSMRTDLDDDEASERTLDVTTPRSSTNHQSETAKSIVPSLSLGSVLQNVGGGLNSVDDASVSSSSSNTSVTSRTARNMNNDEVTVEQLIHQYASLNKADRLRDILLREREKLRQTEDDDLNLSALFSDVVNCVDSRDNSTALHKAAARNNCEVLDVLLKEFKETKIDARDNLDSTALHWACANNALEAIFILCKFGASINVRDKYGYGPIHLTIKKKCFRGADVLMLYNGDINFKMSNGSTALHWACENNEMEIIRWLLTKDKINVHARDKFKETPALRAAAKGNMEVIEFFLQKNLIQWNLRDDKGHSLMHKAAYYGINDLIMRIANANPVACGAMMSEKDRDGNTPLHLAVRKDQFRAMKSLLLMGAAMDIQNKHGDTPLHMAVQLKDYKTARYLHQSGANADIKNKKGLNPRNIAESHAKDLPPNASLKPHEDPLKIFV